MDFRHLVFGEPSGAEAPVLQVVNKINELAASMIKLTDYSVPDVHVVVQIAVIFFMLLQDFESSVDSVFQVLGKFLVFKMEMKQEVHVFDHRESVKLRLSVRAIHGAEDSPDNDCDEEAYRDRRVALSAEVHLVLGGLSDVGGIRQGFEHIPELVLDVLNLVGNANTGCVGVRTVKVPAMRFWVNSEILMTVVVDIVPDLVIVSLRFAEELHLLYKHFSGPSKHVREVVKIDRGDHMDVRRVGNHFAEVFKDGEMGVRCFMRKDSRGAMN
jgi:hypothetical protein